MGDFFCEPIIFRKRWCKTVDISARGKVYSIGDKGGDELFPKYAFLPWERDTEMKTPNFGYNTINGLDEKTIRRLEEEFQRHGYRNKTEFLVALWKKALDDLDSERSLEGKNQYQEVGKALLAIQESLKRIEESQNQNEIKDISYRHLLENIYWMLKFLLSSQNLEFEEIEDGKFDFLPVRLSRQMKENQKLYGNTQRTGTNALL